MLKFPENVSTALPVFYRTYSRRNNGHIESWDDVCKRTHQGLVKLGKLTEHEADLLWQMQSELKCLPSGRWLWVGGTEWLEKRDNHYGAYNCSSTEIIDWKSFALMMDLTMVGCGTGAMLEPNSIKLLPTIRNRLNIEFSGNIGDTPSSQRLQWTKVKIGKDEVHICVGDSRQSWVKSYEALLNIASDIHFNGNIKVVIDLSNVRPAEERLKGFGGVSNPVKLPHLYQRIAAILNKAVSRKLNALECCLLIDEAASTIVAGNVRRSAGMRQGDANDEIFGNAKFGLWQKTDDNQWRIDPERDALRMANHTRVFHRKPTYEECLESVRKQYYSGEGAIQYAPEAIARSNADILNTPLLKQKFLDDYNQYGYEGMTDWFEENLTRKFKAGEIQHRLKRYGLNPCGEICGLNFMCNLSEIHLNQIDPNNFDEQYNAFKAGALSVAALLHHEFTDVRYQVSRDIDPIVGVSFTGLFDFFVKAFGVDWLRWWQAGRPNTTEGSQFKRQEQEYLEYWRTIVRNTVWDYCDRHGLRRPNRYTTCQPAGTKSLLTGASPGWHPPKAARFIRRITFRKNDPVALACIDYGYNVIPSQSDKDENGHLLNDPFSPLCTEWLIEIPCAAIWADVPGADEIDISQFSTLAQFDFAMQVQRHYVTHNTSSTWELRSDEIEDLATAIYQAIQNDQGYISAALLARFDDHQSFPRLPFEPISKLQYEQLCSKVAERQKVTDFHQALSRYIDTESGQGEGPAGCDSDKCLFANATK